jgi:hypothetical protein
MNSIWFRVSIQMRKKCRIWRRICINKCESEPLFINEDITVFQITIGNKRLTLGEMVPLEDPEDQGYCIIGLVWKIGGGSVLGRWPETPEQELNFLNCNLIILSY